MSPKAWPLVGVLCLGSWLLAGEGDNVKYRLAYRFTPEQTVAYEIQQASEIHNTYNDDTEIITNKSDFRRHYRIVSAESDGTGELETVIDRVRMTAYSVDAKDPKTKINEVIFKSDDPEFHPERFRSILASVGKPQAIVKVSSSGKTLKVTPTKEANFNAGDSQKDPTKAPESYLAPLPEEPVAVGDIWKENFQVFVLDDMLPVKIDMLRTYKLAFVEKGVAKIEFRTAILTNVTEPDIQLQLIQRETSGKIAFDLTQGIVLGRDVEVDRTVVGAFQGKGAMRAVSTYRERRVTDEAIAAKPAETEKK